MGILNPREESGETREVSYADTHESPGLLFFFFSRSLNIALNGKNNKKSGGVKLWKSMQI